MRPIVLPGLIAIVMMYACSGDSTRPGRHPANDASAVTDQPKGSGDVTIALQPFETFAPSLLDTIRRSIEREFGVGTSVAANVALPATAFVNVKSPRYRADSLLAWLKQRIGDDRTRVLGLTDRDISTTKRAPDGTIKRPAARYADFGVFGCGYLGGPSAVVSSFRLRKPGNRGLTISRLCKVALHEIGHTYGLPHCPVAACVMSDAAERIATVDRSTDRLCNSCRARIL